ncbi:MAG: hypothetical protein AAGA77_06425 [Bacteroidota bacterium]
MNWNQIYIEQSKNRGLGFDEYVRTRKKRYQSNSPIKPDHFSELEYLIIFHDKQNGLIKKYIALMTDEAKEKWLKKKLSINKNWVLEEQISLIRIKLPLLLLDPAFQNEKIDYYFLIYQLKLILNAIDHAHGSHRLRAEELLDILTKKFDQLKINLRNQLIEILSKNTTRKNIKRIKKFVIKYIKILPEQLVNEFVEEQLKRGLIYPRLAIGIYRRRCYLNYENIKRLEEIIIREENSDRIIKKIKFCT